jgi:hypothetical protein
MLQIFAQEDDKLKLHISLFTRLHYFPGQSKKVNFSLAKVALAVILFLLKFIFMMVELFLALNLKTETLEFIILMQCEN